MIFRKIIKKRKSKRNANKVWCSWKKTMKWIKVHIFSNKREKLNYNNNKKERECWNSKWNNKKIITIFSWKENNSYFQIKIKKTVLLSTCCYRVKINKKIKFVLMKLHKKFSIKRRYWNNNNNKNYKIKEITNLSILKGIIIWINLLIIIIIIIIRTKLTFF